LANGVFNLGFRISPVTLKTFNLFIFLHNIQYIPKYKHLGSSCNGTSNGPRNKKEPLEKVLKVPLASYLKRWLKGYAKARR
jgi:hypothetical protein